VNFGTGHRCHGSRHGGWRGNGDMPSQQWMLLDLSDRAVVIGASSIMMEKTVKLGRNRQREGANPQQEHQTVDRKPAAPARTLCCAPELHALIIMHQI